MLELFTFKVDSCNLCPELVKLVHGIPVNKKPPIVDVFHAPELMLQVVSMFPDVDHQQRTETQ